MWRKKSGKTTLMMDLTFNDAQLINNDITRIKYNKKENLLYGYEWIERVNIGKGTIMDNRKLFAKLDFAGIMDDNNYNNYNAQTDKYEFYKCEIEEFQYNEESIFIEGIIIPHFDIECSRCQIKRRKEIFSSEMLSMLKETWLPVVSTDVIRVQDDIYSRFDFKCKLDIYEIWYDPNATEPAQNIINIINKRRE